jgi:methylated-DNA-[protein]-cysteine S-methyltransferase
MTVSNKDRLRALLENAEFTEIGKLAANSSSTIRYLFSFLYSPDDLLHWRAAEALGYVADLQHSNSYKEGRNIPQRLLWSLMEESGGTAWPATEALGAVVSGNPAAFTDFAPIIMPFLEDPVLQRGVLWSARKISEKRPDLLYDFTPQIIELLDSNDATIRGHAAWALGTMKDRNALPRLEELKNDNDQLQIYENSKLTPVTVGEIAIDSILRIES